MINRAHALLSGNGRTSALLRALIGSMGVRLAGMGLGFLVGVQLARGLGPAGYGAYGIAMSVISLLLIPLEFGVPQLVTREIASASAHGGSGTFAILNWSMRLIASNSLLIAVGSALLLLSDLVIVDPAIRIPLLCGLFMLPTVGTSNILSAALRGVQRIVDGQIAELLIRPAVISILLLLTGLWGAGEYLNPEVAMTLNSVAAVIGTIYAYARLRPELARIDRAPSTPAMRSAWLRSAVPLAMGDGMRILSGQLGVLMLGAFSTTNEVGIYRVAFGIYVVATLPSALLNAVCSPILARLHSENRMGAIQRLNGWMTLLLILSAVACILPFMISGEAIISGVFGTEYIGSLSFLMILLLGELASALLGHPTIALNMLRHESAVTRFSFLALVLNLSLCWALTPSLGGVGAALGGSLSQFAWRLAASEYARRQLGLHTSFLACFKLGIHK